MDIAANIPPLPFVQPDTIAALRPLAVVTINTEDISVSKADIAANIPPLPFVQPDSIPLLTPLAEVALNTENVPLYKEEVVVPIPKIEEKRMPVAEMHLSPDGYSLLQKLEGFSPELYSLNDGGFTIGFGFFVSYSEGAKWKKGITWEEAEQMIRQKMPAYEDQVKEYINIPLTQNEFDALTMLAYNLGGFSKATSIINDINNQVGFDKIQSDWKRFVHSKAPGVTKGLMNRRRDELEVRSISEYQPDRKIQILKK
jgi:type VI secretion system secreted protein VgrG